MSNKAHIDHYTLGYRYTSAWGRTTSTNPGEMAGAAEDRILETMPTDAITLCVLTSMARDTRAILLLQAKREAREKASKARQAWLEARVAKHGEPVTTIKTWLNQREYHFIKYVTLHCMGDYHAARYTTFNVDDIPKGGTRARIEYDKWMLKRKKAKA